VSEPAPKPRLLVHVGLFLATFLTTTAAGALYVHGGQAGGSGWFAGIVPIADGLPYSVPLLAILVCHELGHYFAARAHGVDASLPYFIPLPFGFGTMGAVIGMRGVTADRKKLIDIGAAGPLAGLLVAIPVLAYGLSLSKVGPLVPGGEQEGTSLLYGLLKLLAKGEWLPNGQRDVYLHPTAWAGWAGLLVTMINLLPIGQLDGGHIATAYFGNRYNLFARRLHRMLPVMAVGVFAWVLHSLRGEVAAMARAIPGVSWDHAVGVEIAAGASVPWLIWYAMIRIIRRLSGSADHPPVDEGAPLPASRRALFWLMVVVLVAIFMPVPLRATMPVPGGL